MLKLISHKQNKLGYDIQ